MSNALAVLETTGTTFHTTMRATVFHGVNDLRVEEVRRPRAGAGRSATPIDGVMKVVITR